MFRISCSAHLNGRRRACLCHRLPGVGRERPPRHPSTSDTGSAADWEASATVSDTASGTGSRAPGDHPACEPGRASREEGERRPAREADQARASASLLFRALSWSMMRTGLATKTEE